MKTVFNRPAATKQTGGALLQLTVALCTVLLVSQTTTAQDRTAKTVTLFDGKTLSGWKSWIPADKEIWTVQNGLITGGDGQQKIKSNTYIVTEKEYGDFEFRCLFRLSGDTTTGMINSGIQYRSKIENGNMVGYQADIGNGYWGDIYDEHRRGKLIGGELATLTKILTPDGWNSYIVRVKGNHHELYINGVKTADYIEKDNSVPKKGIIGVQLHAGGAGRIELSDVTITEL